MHFDLIYVQQQLNRFYFFFLDLDEYMYLMSPRFGKIIKPIRLEPKSTWNTRITYEINLGRKILEGVKHFYDYFEDFC